MNDDQVKQVLQETVKFVHNTPMGLQSFRKNKEFVLAVSRIDGTVPFKGASGTVTATHLTADSKDEQLRDHLTRFRGIVLLKFGKDDRVHEAVVPNAAELLQILGCFATEERPSVLRLLLEEFAAKERKCHATVTIFLLTFFATETDAPGPSGLYETDVKEHKPQKRPHSDDRLQSAAGKRHCRGQAIVVHPPVATKASKPPLEGPLADRKLADVDGIDEFVAKRMIEKGFDLSSLFGQLLVAKLCRMAFIEWLMTTVAIGQEDAERCYKCLREYAVKNVIGT